MMWRYRVRGRTDGGVHAKRADCQYRAARKDRGSTILKRMCKTASGRYLYLEDRACKERVPCPAQRPRKMLCIYRGYPEKADVFSRKYTGHYPGELDVSAMGKAAGILVGAHDFAGFTDRKDEKSTIRRIYDIMIERQGEKSWITYRGSGFMYHMVRILTGTLLEVGSGMRSIESVGAALESKVRADAGFLCAGKRTYPAGSVLSLTVSVYKDRMDV